MIPNRSLSHIFPADKFLKAQCLTGYLKSSELISAFKELAYKDSNQLKKVTSRSVLYAKELLDCYNNDESVASVSFVPENKQEEGLLKVCQKINTRGTKIHERSEASFMDCYLMPFLNSMILEETDDTVVYSMIDGSDEKKKKKPDFMVGIQDRKRELYFFYVEVKRPKVKSVYQEEDDYVKLLKQLKESIDNQLKLGMKNPKSFGLLCEGFHCHFYRMSILEEGIYASSCLRRFQLVEDRSIILNVIPATEAFCFVKQEIQSMLERYGASSKKEAKDLQKLIKHSFITNFNK